MITRDNGEGLHFHEIPVRLGNIFYPLTGKRSFFRGTARSAKNKRGPQCYTCQAGRKQNNSFVQETVLSTCTDYQINTFTIKINKNLDKRHGKHPCLLLENQN